MPEPRITICPSCAWKFDLVVYPACPNCRTDKQREEAETLKRIRERRAAAEAEEKAKRTISFLYLVGLYLFGGVSYMMLMNHLMERPLLSIPVIEKVQTVSVKSSDRQAKKAEGPVSPPPTVVQVRTTLEDVVLSVVDWKRGEPAGGKIRYSGRVQNVGPVAISTVSMKLVAKDTAAVEVGSAFARVSPFTLKPLEMGSFEIDLADDERTRTISMEAAWQQLFVKEIQVAGFEEKSSPPPAPGEKAGMASLVLKPEGGGDPVVLTADDMAKRESPGGGEPLTKAAADFMTVLEERRAKSGWLPAGEDGAASPAVRSRPPASGAASPAPPRSTPKNR